MPDDDGTGLLGIIFACEYFLAQNFQQTSFLGVTVGLVVLIILVVIWLVIMLVRNRKKNTDTPVSIPGNIHVNLYRRIIVYLTSVHYNHCI